MVIAILSKNNIVACGSAPLNAFGAGVNSVRSAKTITIQSNTGTFLNPSIYADISLATNQFLDSLSIPTNNPNIVAMKQPTKATSNVFKIPTTAALP